MNKQSSSRINVGSPPIAHPHGGWVLQRRCDCSQHTICGTCSGCQDKDPSLRRTTRRAENETQNSAGVPPIVHEVLRSPGQPLDAATRAFFEPRFGQDFSNVRVHTDNKAAESAHSVNGLAYTFGRNVVFGQGQYAPRTGDGLRVIAHELTHVQQQNNVSSLRPLRLGPPDNSAEREADAKASWINSGITAATPQQLMSDPPFPQEDVAVVDLV
jgi:hypothetical protein